MAKQSTPGNDELSFLSAEDIKAIGEIELGPSRHEKFLNAHYRKLIVGVILFMLAAVACIVYATWRAGQEADGAATIVAALKETTVNGAAESAEFDLAALERAESAYSGTRAAATAELLRGMQLISGGQVQQGISLLEELIRSTDDAFLRVRAQVFLANRYMADGNAAKAKELWQEVVRAGRSPYLALAYFCLGDLANDAGEMEQARAFYDKVTTECAESPLVLNVRQRLLVLGVDAPQPVAPAPQPAEPTPADDELPSWQGVDFSKGVLPR